MDIPTADDINVFNSLDEITAEEHFLNKTVEEAEILFRENSAYYQEDLMWMGPRAFSYYLQAAINYLKSKYSIGDDHFVDSLYEIVMFRIDQEGFSLAVESVKHLADYVLQNYEKFNVDSNIFGDLHKKYAKLVCVLADME